MGSVCFASFSAVAAVAADADPGTNVDPVIVTARKRAEDVQKVPIAITAVQATQLKDGKLNELSEVMNLVPNVSFKNDQFTSSDVSIRGSSRNDNAEEPGVGIVRDGVYVGGLLTNTSTFYDLDRVEVLRGPQAGLYGRNAVGGAVNLLTVKPAYDIFDGYVNAQYGTLERAEVRGAVNIPLITDKLAVRLSGLVVDQRQGFIHVVNLGQYADAYKNASARLRIRFAPVENVELLTTVEHYNTHGTPTGPVLNNPFAGPYTVDGQVFQGASPETINHLQLNVPTNARGDQTQFIQEANYTTGAGVLTGVFGYRTTDFVSSLDNDGTIIDESDVLNLDHQNATYADLRFASRDFGAFHFLAGATYMNENTQLNLQYKSGGLFGTNLAQWYTTGLVTENPFGIPVGTPITDLGLTPLGNSGGWSGDIGDSFPVTSINEQRLKSISAYLEGNYKPTDALEFWANVRYTHDDKELHFSQFFGNTAHQCPIACAQVFDLFVTDGVNTQITLDTSHAFENVSPGGGVNYALSSNVQLYGKVVTGFKAGGFNNLASSAARLPFNSETTISDEVGVKSNWFDNRLVLNGDVFYQLRKGALVEVSDPVFASIGVTYGVNAGLIENRGVELEARARPMRGLDISVAAGYLDSHFVHFLSGGIDYAGNMVPTTFRYSLSESVTYNWPLVDHWDGFAYLSYSNRWKGYTNNDNALAMRSPEQLDVRLGAKGTRWNLIGFVNNVTDARYAPYEDYVPGVVHVGTISPGRTSGLEIDYNF